MSRHTNKSKFLERSEMYSKKLLKISPKYCRKWDTQHRILEGRRSLLFQTKLPCSETRDSRALKDVFNKTATDVATILKDLGFTAMPIAE